MGTVYLIQNNDDNLYKIGVTKGDANVRLHKLQTGNPQQLKLVSTYESKYPFRLEFLLHTKFRMYNILNEWYDLPKEIVENFHDECERMNCIIISLKDNYFFRKKLK